MTENARRQTGHARLSHLRSFSMPASLMTIQELRQEGQDLAPTEARIEEMRIAVHIIAQSLYRNQPGGCTRFSAVKLAGSLGKKTSLKDSDADIVVFCTNPLNPAALPPSGTAALLQHMQGVLLRCGVSEIRRTNRALVLKLGNTSVDLLVARDFYTGDKKPGNPDQACAALEHISRMSPALQEEYSVCFAELTVEWFKQQSSTTNAFVRLVKHRLLLSDEALFEYSDGTAIAMKTHAKENGITGETA